MRVLFFLAKFVEAWAMPTAAGCLLGLLGLGLSWRRPRAARVCLGVGLAMLCLLGMGAVADRLLAPLERAYPPAPPSLRAEAAVVLAGTVDLSRSTLDRIEFFDAPERLLEGARLVKAGRARFLVISGGSGDPLRPDVSEADFLARFAQELGVSSAVTFLQRGSHTTAEDARFTAALLKERGIRTFFLVTSAFHMPRAMGCFRKAGLHPIAFPVDFRATPFARGVSSYTPTAGGLSTSTTALHEYLGYGVYRLLGRL